MIINRTVKFWKKRFALFPIFLNDGPNRQIIWLQWVWKRDCGIYTEVCTTDPAIAQAQETQ